MPLLAVSIGIFSKKYTTYTTIYLQEAAIENPVLEDFRVKSGISDRAAGFDALIHSRQFLKGVLEMSDTDWGGESRARTNTNDWANI